MRDTGFGISAADQAKSLFQEFQQTQESKRLQKGRHSASGLAISKRIIEMHGGRNLGRSPSSARDRPSFVTLPVHVHAQTGRD